MQKFFNEKITTRDISKFLNDTTKTQITAGSGLLLIKTTSNSASWQYRFLFNDKRFVYTIGTLNDVDLPTAQATHKELWQKVANGVNVAVEKQNAKGKVKSNTAFSLSKLAQFFIKHSENLQADTNYAKNTISLIQRFLIEPKFELFKSKNIENAFNEKISVENFVKSPASEITEIDIKNYLNNIKHRTSKQKIANLLLAIYKKAITYKQTTKITANPAEIVNNKTEIRFAKSERSRLVSDIEIKELFKLLNNSKNQTLATATKLLFLLGVRKNELLKAEWSEFDLNNAAVWTLPAERSKNKKSIKIPLSQPVITLLKSLQNNQNNQSKFVFNSFHKNNTGAISSAILNIYICNLINNNSIIKENITPHDARRYVRTTLNKILDGNATEKQFICERVLNHSLMLQGVNTQILNTYLIDDFFAERKNALEKLADYILKITSE